MTREFTQDELEALAYRAEIEGLRQSRLHPRLARAYQALSDAAYLTYAAERLHFGPEQGQEPSEGPEGAEADTEPPEPVEGESEALLAGPGFNVRPKKADRLCVVPGCGLPQWRSPSGWVCDNGHGGVPPLEE